MARGAATTRNVEFATEVVSYRAPRDDERSVMEHFAKHSSRCQYCRDPYDAYRHDTSLCSRGTALAKDVSKYLYSKGSKPFSIIDRENGERVQVQIPAGCEVITLLVKAFGKGLNVDSRRVVVDNSSKHETIERPIRVISPAASPAASPSSLTRRREYYVDEKPRERRYISHDDYETVEIKPHSSRNDRRERIVYRDERRERPKSLVYEGKGSLFNEEEQRRQRRYERQPVVIVAEPRYRR